MNCPNCYKQISDSYLCSNCGTDPVLFKNITKLSNKFYNQGLKNLKDNNLSDAIESFYKSIQFNKNNYNSRNLLGLTYFQTGCIGNAIKEWIISSSITKENNLAVYYMEIIQKNSSYVETLNEATKIYNKSLKTIKLKNEDLAIIQLKKAIDINANLLEAYNLLAFCYLSQKNSNKASELVNKVLSKDSGNKTANHYNNILNTINKASTKTTTLNPIKQQLSGRTSIENKPSYDDNKKLTNAKAKALSLIIGILISSTIFYLIFLPITNKNIKNKLLSTTTELDGLQLKYTQDIASRETEINDLMKEINDIKVEKADLDKTTLLQQQTLRVRELQDIFLSRDYDTVANILYEEDFSGLSEEYQVIIDDLKTRTFPSSGLKEYTNGINNFNNSNFEDAKINFEKALVFLNEDNRNIPPTLYHIGLIEEINANFDKAREYFTILIEKYPNTNNAAKAQASLNNLG